MGFFKKRTKEDVAEKIPFSHSEKKNGKPAKSGTVVTFKDGKSVTLLTPSGKGTKYAEELRTNVAVTNDGIIKRDCYDMPVELTAEQRAYRAGYLDSQKDSIKTYKAKAAAKKK